MPPSGMLSAGRAMRVTRASRMKADAIRVERMSPILADMTSFQVEQSEDWTSELDLEGTASWVAPDSLSAHAEAMLFHPDVGFVAAPGSLEHQLHQYRLEVSRLQAARFRRFRRAMRRVSRSVQSAVKVVAKPVVQVAKQVAQVATQVARAVADTVGPVLERAWDWVQEGVNAACNWGSAASAACNFIGDRLSDLGNAVSNVATAAWGAAQSLGEIIVEGARDLARTTLDLLDGLVDGFVEWGKGMIACARAADFECMLKETLLAVVRGAFRVADSIYRLVMNMANTAIRLTNLALDLVGDIFRALMSLTNRLLEATNIIRRPAISCPGQDHFVGSGAVSFKGVSNVPGLDRVNKFKCPLMWYNSNTIRESFVPNRLTDFENVRRGDVFQLETEMTPPASVTKYPFLRRNIVTVIPDMKMLTAAGLITNQLAGRIAGINMDLFSICYIPELDRYCTNQPFRTGLMMTPGVNKILYRHNETADISAAKAFGCSGYAGCQCEPTCSICPVLTTPGADENDPEANILMLQNPQHPNNMSSVYVGSDQPRDFADLRTRLHSNIVNEAINGGNKLDTSQDVLYRASCIYPADAWKGTESDINTHANHALALTLAGNLPEEVFDAMIRTHCQQATDEPRMCPPDGLGQVPNTCMRLHTSALCTRWWSGTMRRMDGTPYLTESEKDVLRGTICTRFPHAPECDCMRPDVLEYKENNPYDENEKALPCPSCGVADRKDMHPRCRVRCLAYRDTLQGMRKGGRPMPCNYPACMGAGRALSFQSSYTVAAQENCATICTNNVSVLGNSTLTAESLLMSVDSCGNTTSSPLNPRVLAVSSGVYDDYLKYVAYGAALACAVAFSMLVMSRRSKAAIFA